MIDWRRYKSRRGVDCWSGWINGSPLYAITPFGDGFTLSFLAVNDLLKIDSGSDIEALQSKAAEHWAANLGEITSA